MWDRFRGGSWDVQEKFVRNTNFTLSDSCYLASGGGRTKRKPDKIEDKQAVRQDFLFCVCMCICVCVRA